MRKREGALTRRFASKLPHLRLIAKLHMHSNFLTVEVAQFKAKPKLRRRIDAPARLPHAMLATEASRLG